MSLQYRQAPSSVRPSVVAHHFQTSSPKPLGQLKSNFIWSLHVIGERKFVRGDLGHLTKMAATPIYGKKLLEIFSSGTKGPMTLGLGIQHLGLRPNKVYSNDDFGLTLTFLRHCQRIKFTKPHNRPCKQKF